MTDLRVVAFEALPGRAAEQLGPGVTLEIHPPDAEDRAVDAGVVGLLVTVANRVDGASLERWPALQVVASASAGTDHLALADLAARHVQVLAVPDVLTETTADLAWALILAASRRLGEGERAVRGGTWQGWSPLYMTGVDVHGRTLGIVGLGRIGTAVARRAQGFAMRLLYHSRHPSPTAPAVGATYVSLDTLCAQSDIVVLCLPGSPETRGLLSAPRLARMRDDAVLVNVGRGDAVDLQALDRELARGRFAGVGLDVFPVEPLPPTHPILRHERVVAVPHIGSATRATRIRMVETAASALGAALRGQPLPKDAVRVVEG